MLSTFKLYCTLLCMCIAFARDIHDPLNIFCGKDNCYDIIGVPKTASNDEIKKAYRKLSIAHHPDKNAGTVEQSTVNFQKISKAYEVLKGNESRPLFDYYLAHPWDYYKVSGSHFMRNAPNANVGVVILGVLLVLSAIMYHSQKQKYQEAVDFLLDAVLKNLGPRNGGTEYTQNLFNVIAAEYNEQVRAKAEAKALAEGKSVKKAANVGNVPKARMLEDPLFVEIATKTVNAVEIDGAARKPAFDDILIVWLLKYPLKLLGGGKQDRKQE